MAEQHGSPVSRKAVCGSRDAATPQAEPPQAQPAALSKDALVDLIREHMRGVYHCTRVWEAWSVGTMSEDDFDPYDESDSPDELADVILAALSAHPSAPPQAQPAERAEQALRSIMDFRHTPHGMVRGGRYINLDDAVCAIHAALSAHPVETAAQPEPESLGASLAGPLGAPASPSRSPLQPPAAASAAIVGAIPPDPFVGLPADRPAEWRKDPCYPLACQVVRDQKRAAISTVQRHLRIGYNRAARLLEAMVGDVITEMPPTTKLLPARRIECDSTETAGLGPEGEEPGAAGTRPEPRRDQT